MKSFQKPFCLVHGKQNSSQINKVIYIYIYILFQKMILRSIIYFALLSSLLVDFCVGKPEKMAIKLYVMNGETTTDDLKNTTTRLCKMALAGGLAGAVSTALLFPLDTLKTLKQIPPQPSSSISSPLIIKSLLNLYSGFFPSVLGSIPSSFLYFGSYEASKHLLHHNVWSSNPIPRPLISTISAAIGNIASSIIFVPKDAIKSQMQGIKSNRMVWEGASHLTKVHEITAGQIIIHTLKTKGIKGLYPSYRATLARNIPSAVFRFAIYEELRHMFSVRIANNVANPKNIENVGYLIAGALASSLSSVATTPIDVVKTRIATGIISANTPIYSALIDIGRKEGPLGLFAGVEQRALWSGAFGSIGFVSYEKFKQLLKVENVSKDATS